MSRNISQAMATWLASDVLTFATCAQITRKDGTAFGFTDHDADIVYNGFTYQSRGGYSPSAVEAADDLSTANLEINALFLDSGGAVTQADIEAGLWDNAAVLIFGVNYADLTMGQVNLTAGNLGQFTILNGGWKVELRGLAQTLQQTISQMYSPSCRALFGDSRCKLTPPTASGMVASVTTAGMVWSDPSLTQTGPVSEYIDTIGYTIPTASPYQIIVVPPSGSWASSVSVVDGGKQTYGQTGGSPGNLQYSVTPNADGSATYTFNSNNAGNEIFINFNYAQGYFSFGTVRWTSGANAGYSFNVRTFSPGVVTLSLPTPFPISAGDQYVITAGCDRQIGTCVARWNNVVNFRGEPYIPGPDVILAPLS
ncbi:DUF2163 domain-containing protein [Paraburkholderia tuberum]|uniref:Bacteriophage phiJL001 Gp84 C-terminal domain-containing protein n=1 Tax=Paraburkholderia tuberum TaxID=157910 RepID=A0A1H1JBB1_9BURK|nr:DUF2163 domain-containing protein [Paraburkholderia tuberum]SDR47050.1 phage conserved hypothetical protein BR0599 [Paraburkholderia tuberum]